MSSPSRPDDRPDPDDRPPSWAGAPGYQPNMALPPHAPMPGAPPYPAHQEHPPPPVGQVAAGTRFAAVLAAAGTGALLNLVLVLMVEGVPRSGGGLGGLVGLLLAVALVVAGVVWLAVRARRRSFGLLLAVTVPAVLVVRALVTLITG
ncbi:MAG TPA: hypothetical protein VEZ42_02385 [Pseudonocardia sp.]|nr:hypothetical protein [Pseudonocardia sp.]